MQRRRRNQLVLSLSMALAAAVFVRPAAAVEPMREVIEVLCQRMWFDTAVDYLETLKTSALVPETTRAGLTYEQALVLIRAAETIPDHTVKERHLGDAAQKLREFTQANPNGELVTAANNQMATILIRQAQTKAATAQSQPESKTKLVTEARTLLTEAQQRFAAAEKVLDQQFKQFPRLIDPDDREQVMRKQQVAENLVLSQMMGASVDYEMARLAEPGTPEARNQFKVAADKFAKLFLQYRTRGAGLEAHYWEARCYQEMGDDKQALGCFRELIDLPNEPAYALLRTRSLRQAMAIWSSPREKKYQAVIEAGEKWLDGASSSMERDPDALAIRYLTAVACQESAKTTTVKDPSHAKLLNDARRYLTYPANFPNEFQKPAKIMLAALEKSKPKGVDTGPKTFGDAVDEGKAALELQQTAVSDLATAQEAKDEAQIADAKQRKKDNGDAALALFRRAIALADAKTPIEELNAVRHFVAYLNYEFGNYHDAAVLGDFLAKHYAETDQGRLGASLAMWSYVKLRADSKEKDKSWESAQIMRMAQRIVEKWPQEPEAEQAGQILLTLVLETNQVEKALELLNKIPEDAPGRGQAELSTGDNLWRAYLTSMRLPEAERPGQTQLDQLKKNAQEVLEKGIKRMEGNDVNPTMVGAASSLAQIYIDTGQHDKAIAILENPKYGPLTLVKAGSEITKIGSFPVETHKLALRAYVAKQELKKAEEEMNALEAMVASGGDAKANETLTAIYIQLGRELQQQLKLLNKEEAQNLTKGFELFLTRIASRDKGNSYGSLSWVAETFYNMATGLDDNAGFPTGDVKKYYEQAIATYERILTIAKTNPNFMPEEHRTGIELRIAACCRRTNRFDQALNILTGVLRQNQMLLAVQVQAAETYQARGVNDKSGYERAILGSPSEDGKSVIWGWAKISKMTMSNPKFETTFHHARRNLAESRFRYGQTVADPAQQKKFTEAAKTDIRNTYLLFPEMGGQDSYAKYDALLKSIQQSLGTKAIGLEEFKTAAPNP